MRACGCYRMLCCPPVAQLECCLPAIGCTVMSTAVYVYRPVCVCGCCRVLCCPRVAQPEAQRGTQRRRLRERRKQDDSAPRAEPVCPEARGNYGLRELGISPLSELRCPANARLSRVFRRERSLRSDARIGWPPKTPESDSNRRPLPTMRRALPARCSRRVASPPRRAPRFPTSTGEAARSGSPRP